MKIAVFYRAFLAGLLVSLGAVPAMADQGAQAASNRVVLRAALLLDGDGKAVTDPYVVIRDDRIEKVGSGAPPAYEGARSIDLRPRTLLPGLIDVHTHLTYAVDPQAKGDPWKQLEVMSDIANVFLAQEPARRTLQAGVTTVRDLGSFHGRDLAMRDLINRGLMLGPQMLVAGTGLHVSGACASGHCEPEPGEANGVPEVLRAARQELASGADWVKMYASTGSDQDLTGFQTFSRDEIGAAVFVAHSAGKKIAVHSYGPKAARDAAELGADSIEHAVDLDDATLAVMMRNHVVYVPTISHNLYYRDHRELFGYDDKTADAFLPFVERNLQTTRRALKAGVIVAMGSDAVLDGAGENARELECLVRAGMTAQQAIESATVTGARLLGMEKEIGTLAPGFRADLIAVDGDPRADITAISRRVAWTMRAGREVVPLGTVAPSPMHGELCAPRVSPSS